MNAQFSAKVSDITVSTVEYMGDLSKRTVDVPKRRVMALDDTATFSIVYIVL